MPQVLKHKTIKNFSVSGTKALPIGSLKAGFEHVILQIRGHSKKFDLVPKGENDGIQVPLTDLQEVGPIRVQGDGAYTHINSSSQTISQIEVYIVSGSEPWRNRSVSDDIDIDEVNADIRVEGEYNATRPNLTDGDTEDFQLDEDGRLITQIEQAFQSIAEEILQTAEQEVNETFKVTLLGSGLGPKKYVGDPPAAEHTVSSSAARLFILEGFVPDGEGAGNQDFLQIWDGDPSGSGSLVTSVPFKATGSGADRLPPYSTSDGEDLPGGCYIVLSKDPVTYNPVGYNGYIFARYQS